MLLQLVGGLPTLAGWASLVCFILSRYLMIELSNQNALLRVRSRMVTSTFIVLSGAAGCLFGTVSAALSQLFVVIALLVLFTTYQDDNAPGLTFYAFGALGMSSLFFAPALCYVPMTWVLMATQLQSLSWRTWAASLLGLLAPYWLVFAWLLFSNDLQPLAQHFALLGQWAFPPDYGSVTIGQWAALLLVLALAATGAIHFWTRSYEDKIRIRLLYGFFTVMSVVTTLLFIAQPHYYEPMMRLLLITVCPLIAHFFTHTSSRLTNIVFFTTITVALAITILNLQCWSF